MLPSESALCLGTLTFQIAGVGALGAGMMCRSDHPRLLRMLMVASLAGLGTLTVLSAIQQSMLALSAGFALTVLMLGAIHSIGGELNADPYSNLYPPEESAVNRPLPRQASPFPASGGEAARRDPLPA